MRVLLGMSGGLDSTYAARLLLRAGHTVEGAVLIMHDYTEADAARESAAALGIPLHEIDCRERFDREVVLPFCGDYRAAKTPNPCILCNERVKFAVLYEKMQEWGFDRIATGHYARIKECEGRLSVLSAEDGTKDQSYVLYRLPQEVLSHLLLPLGEKTKSAVRSAAAREGLRAADRSESMEICFLPEGDHAAYITERFGPLPQGNFVDTEGRVLSPHRGILHYTVGQRKGLGVALGERMFVTHIDPASGNITLARDGERAVSSFSVERTVFSGISERDAGEESFLVKLRYLAPLLPCRVRFSPEGAEVMLDTPVRTVTPGQSAVFYREDAVAFGGFIV